MSQNRSNASTNNSGKPKLLDQVRNALRVRHLALSTEKTYVDWIRRFILFHNKRQSFFVLRPCSRRLAC